MKMGSKLFNPQERDRELCRNITEANGHILRYIEGISKDDFLIDIKTQDAVAMRLQQILENASKLSIDSKAKLKIDWSSMSTMRNIISHSYDSVDTELVWNVVKVLGEFQSLIQWAKNNS